MPPANRAETCVPPQFVSGSIPVYHQLPRELAGVPLAQFGEALRAFARFRMGALLLQEGKKEEALAALKASGPFSGLIEAMRTAPDQLCTHLAIDDRF